MTRASHPPFTGGVLDRDATTRLDEGLLDAAWSDPASRMLRVHEGRLAIHEVTADGAALELRPIVGRRGPEHLYLGRTPEGPRFAEMVAEIDAAPAPAAGWMRPLDIGSRLDELEGELGVVALALAAWHASAQYSPRDGSMTRPAQGGWMRIDAHGIEHYPRTDPVVIVLVEHGDRLLLGSNTLWESGRFSLLAGFVEAGESAEHAVIREVAEESGLLLADPVYVASQPWPFPRSFMLGFRARLADGVDPARMMPDPLEISELRWFTRAELHDPPPGISLPGEASIARWLIDLWVAEGDG